MNIEERVARLKMNDLRCDFTESVDLSKLGSRGHPEHLNIQPLRTVPHMNEKVVVCLDNIY